MKTYNLIIAQRLVVLSLGLILLLSIPSCRKSCPDPSEGCQEFCSAQYDSKCHFGVCDCIGPEPEYFKFKSDWESDPRCRHISRFQDNTWQVLSDACGIFDGMLFWFKSHSPTALSVEMYMRDSHNKLIDPRMEGFGGSEPIYVEHPDGRVNFEFFMFLSEHPYLTRYEGQRIIAVFYAEIDIDGIMRIDVKIHQEEPPKPVLKECRLIMTKLK
jgi:hypothetical protein